MKKNQLDLRCRLLARRNELRMMMYKIVRRLGNGGDWRTAKSKKEPLDRQLLQHPRREDRTASTRSSMTSLAL
jgi:hypothetical protein